MSKKTMRVYGCGGCGINITSVLTGKDDSQFAAELLPALVDTSRSNLQGRKVDPENTYLVEGLDGSGKVRAENYHAIDKEIRQILVNIPPGDINIVVCSAAGGSGSVIGPLLVRELQDRGIPVIILLVGDDSSIISAENTMKTLQSLNGIADNTGVPVVMSYVANGEQRASADKSVLTTIACLAVLFSGQNLEMDSKDLLHWLLYHKVTGVKPQLSSLRIATKAEEYARINSPMSVASLYNTTDQSHLRTGADYHSIGYTDLSETGFNEIHYAISVEDVVDIGKVIVDTVDKMREVKAARVTGNSPLNKVDGQSTDKGMIL